MKIVGNTVGTTLPKPNLMQDDPSKGDYVKGRDEFLEQIPGGPGGGYVLTEADKQEIAELTAELVDVPTDAHINSLINTALGVIENGTY